MGKNRCGLYSVNTGDTADVVGTEISKTQLLACRRQMRKKLLINTLNTNEQNTKDTKPATCTCMLYSKRSCFEHFVCIFTVHVHVIYTLEAFLGVCDYFLTPISFTK